MTMANGERYDYSKIIASLDEIVYNQIDGLTNKIEGAVIPNYVNDIIKKKIKKKQEWFLQRLREIRAKFNIFKGVLYNEKIDDVDIALAKGKLSTAEEFQISYVTLKKQLHARLEVACVLRELKLESLKYKYEAQEQAIRQNFKNDKEILYDSIKANLEKKIQQLDEARNEIIIDASLWSGRSLTQNGRGRGRHPYCPVKSKDKSVVVSGPCIVYMLKEHEIIQDWAAIKRILLSAEREKNADQL